MTKRRKYRPRKLYTHQELQRLVAPDKSGKQRVYLSKELEGFGVLVSGCSATKSYIVQRIVDGRTIRLTIGQTRIFDNIEEAVGKGKQLLGRIYDFASGAGKDPRQKQPDTDPVHKTLRQALADYTASDELRQTSKDLYEYVVNKYLADWRDKPLAEISSDMVVERYSRIRTNAANGDNPHKRNGIATANLCLTTLSAIWGAAADAGCDLPPCPTSALRRRGGRKGGRQRGLIERRGTMIEDADWPRLYRAILQIDSTIYRDLLLLILYTGLRRGAGSGLQWPELDFKNKTARIPAARMKAGRPLELPLPDVVIALLQKRPRLEGNPYVFPANRGVQPATCPNDYLARAARSVNVKAVERDEAGIVIRRCWPCVNDLRRNMARLADEIAGIYVTKAILGHRPPSNDVTSGYRVVTLADKRKAMDAIANRIAQLCGITPLRQSKAA